MLYPLSYERSWCGDQSTWPPPRRSGSWVPIRLQRAEHVVGGGGRGRLAAGRDGHSDHVVVALGDHLAHAVPEVLPDRRGPDPRDLGDRRPARVLADHLDGGVVVRRDLDREDHAVVEPADLALVGHGALDGPGT